MRSSLIVCMLCTCVLFLGGSSEACPPEDGLGVITYRSPDDAVTVTVRSTDVQSGEATAVTVLVFVAVVLGSFVAIAGPACDARRSRRRRRRHTTPLDPRLVAMLTRKERARAFVVGAIAMVAALAVIETMKDPAPHLLLLVAPLVLFVRSMSMFGRAQLVLSLLRDPRFTTRYDGSRFIFVLAGNELVSWITAWPSTLEREIARGVPMATVLN